MFRTNVRSMCFWCCMYLENTNIIMEAVPELFHTIQKNDVP